MRYDYNMSGISVLDEIKELKTPMAYEKLRIFSKSKLQELFSQLFSYKWKGDRKFEKMALRWLFIHYPLEFMKYVPAIPKSGSWEEVIELLFDVSDNRGLRNEFSRSFSAEEIERCKLAQKEVISYLIWRIKTDYTMMNSGEVCSDCAVHVPADKFATLARLMNIDTGEFRRVYITPLRAYIDMLTSNYKKWDKVPWIAVTRLHHTKL